MTASIRSAAAALLLRQHLSSFYACGVMDLRKFEDAVTFKILMELKKVGGDHSPRK